MKARCDYIPKLPYENILKPLTISLYAREEDEVPFCASMATKNFSVSGDEVLQVTNAPGGAVLGLTCRDPMERLYKEEDL
jgi:hypothetical protein